MARKIEVVEYNPHWKKQFKEEAKLIKKILGKNCVTVNHIGSTAVKGMCAKPIIDIMPVVKDTNVVDALNSEFEKLGYECLGEYGIEGRRFYRKGGDNRTHHIHIFQKDDKENIDRHLAVRDYLAFNPEVAKEYGELKKKLAEEFAFDSEAYCNGKDAFVKDLEQKALKWHEQVSRQSAFMSCGMCIGYAIGMAIGIASDNMVYGPLGLSIGMAVGIALSNIKK